MENKNVLLGAGFLVVGILLGWLIASGNRPVAQVPGNMHMMSDGRMMQNGMMGMEGAMGNMMAGLEGKSGDAFDKAFLEEMTVHHLGAVEMAELVLATSKRPELIKLATDIISAQTKEIEMMQDWHKQWFK